MPILNLGATQHLTPEAGSLSPEPAEQHARSASSLPLGSVILQLLPALAQRRQLLILALFRSLGGTSQDLSLFFWWHFHVTLGEKKQKIHLLSVK